MSSPSFPGGLMSGSNRSRRRRVRRSRKRFFLPRLVGLEQRVMLATDFWTGHSASIGGNNNWSNAANWSLNAVPGATDTADFTSSQSQFGSANVDVAESAGSVVIDGTWNGTLTVTSSLTISGNFTLASGTLNGNGTISAAESAVSGRGARSILARDL